MSQFDAHFRLITKDTLEERIMGLQKFKMNIANTVISTVNIGKLNFYNFSVSRFSVKF